MYGFSSSCKFGHQGPVSTVRLRRCLCCIYPYFTKTEAHWLLLSRKCDGTDVWILDCLSLWVWGTSLLSQHHKKLLLRHDRQANGFKQCVTLSSQNTGKVLFLRGRKGINRECVFRPLSMKNCLDSNKRALQPSQRTELPESGQCLPCPLNAL